VLAAEALLGDHALDLGGLVEGLVLALDLAGNNVLAHVVLLLIEGEGLDDVVSPLSAETVGALNVGDSGDFLVALFDNAEEDGGEVGADDAAADGLAFALTSAGGSVALLTYKGLVDVFDWFIIYNEKERRPLTSSEEDARAGVHQDALLHLEALLVVAAGDSEDVALELFAHDFTIDFLAHSSVVEGTATRCVRNRWQTRHLCVGADGVLTCSFHRQFQSFFGHRWWGR
jgi:hypothetical protein